MPIPRQGALSAVWQDLDPLHSPELRHVCGNQGDLMPNARGRDPQIVRANQRSGGAQRPRDPTVGKSSLFIDGQQNMEFPDGAQHRILHVVEALREFTECGRGQQELDVRIGVQECMCGTVDLSTRSLALEVDEERRVERYSSRQGSPGGASDR